MMWSTMDAFRDLESMRRQINNLFSDWDQRSWQFPYTRFSFLPGRAARAYPLLNLSEDEENLYVEALAPGLDPKSLNITVVHRQLTITGEKTPVGGDVKPEAIHRSERAGGRFYRTIELKTPINDRKITAQYHDGLISVVLPKAEEAKPQKITVNVV